MGRKVVIRLAHRRRREGKTDYRQRLKALMGRQTRLVVRRSLKKIACQLIEHNTEGDHVLLETSSTKLKSFGWNYSCDTIPAAYLTGLLAGIEAKKKGIAEAILDIGLYPSTKGNRLYAALAGFIDAGVAVPCRREILPPPERLSGRHIADYAAKLKSENPGRYNSLFSGYLKAGLAPENIAAEVEKTKNAILTAGKK